MSLQDDLRTQAQAILHNPTKRSMILAADRIYVLESSLRHIGQLMDYPFGPATRTEIREVISQSFLDEPA